MTTMTTIDTTENYVMTYPKSKKHIIDTVVQETGLKREYINLMKFEGEYYWSGKQELSSLKVAPIIEGLMTLR